MMYKIFILFFLGLFTTQTYSQTLTDSLLIYYPFDGNALDQSGNGYDGSANATLVSDRFGNPLSAYSFNGSTEFIDLPNASELKPDLPISISVWVKFNDLSASNTVIFTNNYSTDNHSGVWLNASSSGRIAINYGSALGGSTGNNIRHKVGTTQLQTDTWYQIVGIVRGMSDMDLYINCVNDGGTYGGNSSSPLGYTSDAGSIGRKDVDGSSPYYFDGILDDFKYWNRSLTEQEVQDQCTIISIEEEVTDLGITIYPSPANDMITITDQSKRIHSIELYDVQGNLIHQSNYTPRMDISSLSSGFYLVLIKNKQGELIKRDKIIVE